MWKVTATGARTGTEYVFMVDAPDYAPESAVWDAACRQHGQENQRRTPATREFLDIRPGSYQVEPVDPS
jgi:Tfp pilus assembly protein FimV